ncbi:GDP-mannose 4,6-dehydratase [Actinomycetes bacterium KLBMP 9759]
MSDVVAVTGAEGFIGSHLVEELVRNGDRVRAMVLYNSFGSWGWLDTLPPDVLAEVEMQFGDVRDPGCVGALVDDARIVYHLAALIAIPYSYRAPRSYVDTNVLGTLNVLDAVREHDVPRLVHTSTSETYGTARTVPITEAHPLQAQSPYAASKVAADKLVESYHLSFGVPAVTLRPFNTFGPRQSTRAVIPTIIEQLLAGADEISLGALDPVRDFTYVGDTVRAFLAVGTAPASGVVGELFNAGTGVEVSIGRLATEIVELVGTDAVVIEDDRRTRPKDSEVMRLMCDATALRERTGWQPLVDRRNGLLRTIEWFRDRGDAAQRRQGGYSL